MRTRHKAALATVSLAFAGLTAIAPDAAASGATGGYDQFIVTFSNTAASKAAALPDVTAVRELGSGGVVVRPAHGLDLPGARRLMTKLAKHAGVASVEPDLIMTAQSEPNDPRYKDQWDYYEPTGGMNLPGAWDRADGTGVTVAVIDTGITKHADLNANILPGYDFISDATAARDGNGRDADPTDQGDWYAAGECGETTPSNSSWHGTHVAGTIAALSNNGLGVAGIAPKAKILPVRVLGKCGGRTSDIVDAITWASGGKVARVPANPTPAKVINMSLGGSGRCAAAYQKAINSAVSRGTTVVVAAGNSNADVANFTPASCNNTISVAASDREGNRAFYSNFGTLIDFTAPGGEVRNETDAPGTRTKPQDGILSTLNAGTTIAGAETYQTYMGTSMAAPHVAGLAALMLSRAALSPAQVESAIKAHVRPLPGTCSGGCGAGLVDAAATVGAL